jgi:hypothetical protein
MMSLLRGRIGSCEFTLYSLDLAGEGVTLLCSHAAHLTVTAPLSVAGGGGRDEGL